MKIMKMELKLQTNLVADGYKNCLVFHAGVEGGQATRKETLEKFTKGEIRLVIATDLLARGVDIEDITHVINYDAPQCLYFLFFFFIVYSWVFSLERV
uniref:Helicase C-terminal domain-containing protein n=1 Tax=Meloidogyne incognita TaxID=6306 RepID=A0A914NJT4_MELIC